ncbi:MAG: right-handed parallel beta-helix repeat-containing protein [bacterium]|nr:right-handed parallel beta-helix repeat-containing protein [bacterium]
MKRFFSFLGMVVGLGIFTVPSIVNATNVSGVISTNTVWNTAGSPYIVTGNILVNTGVTLNIEPGVEVKLDSAKYIMIKGTLRAIGTLTDSIIITKNGNNRWDRLWLKSSSIDSLQYCRIEYAGNSAIYADSVSSIYIGNNTISNNITSNAGAGIYICHGSITIDSNMISRNWADAWGGGIWGDSSVITITNNTISSNSADWGAGIYVFYCTATISHNTVCYDSGGGAGIFTSYSATTISHNNINNNYTTNYGGGILSDGSPIITDNIIFNNYANNTWGGGICCWHMGDANNPTITNNFIYNNYGLLGGGIYTGSSEGAIISNNTIVSNSAELGGGIYGITNQGILDTPLIITNNTISNNFATNGSSIWCSQASKIVLNTIVDTTEMAILDSADSFIDNNNIYTTTGYAITNKSTSNIDARYNYWGITDSAVIAAQKIWDYWEDFNVGEVFYVPFLTSGDTTAPVPPPFNITNFIDSSGAHEITLSWDSLNISDISGYKIWYDDTLPSPEFCYDGTGANEGNSPVDVGNVTSFKLTGLTAPFYFLAVTAYDRSGDSSWYSNRKFVSLVGIEENADLGLRNAELRISKNPFIKSTVICYSLPEYTNTRITIYDLSGRSVKTLVNGMQKAGSHNIELNTESLTGGVYFVKLEAGKQAITRKVVVLR